MRPSWSLRILPFLFLSLSLSTLSGPAGAADPTNWRVSPNGSFTDQYGYRSGVQGDGVARDRRIATGVAKSASSDPWRPVGPLGGDVGDVAVSPTKPGIVLAANNPEGGNPGGGLYRSEDHGASWSRIAAFNDMPVYDLEFAVDGTAYLAAKYGMWSSADDGATWSQVSLGLGGFHEMALDIEIDPADKQRIWVGAYDFSGNHFVLCSLDGGANWNDVTPAGMGNVGCLGIAFDPDDNNKVFACFGRYDGASAFCVSTDYGNTWSNRTPTLPSYYLVDVEYYRGQILVTGGQLFGGQNVGLLASNDDGLTWKALHDSSWPVLVFSDIEIDPGDPDNIYLASEGAGVCRSLDQGLTWEFGVGGTDGLTAKALGFAAAGSETLFLGLSSFAVFKSNDGGASFEPSSNGITALSLFGMDANPLNLDELAVSYQALNSGGVFTSIDGGLSWKAEACPSNRWNAVRFAPDGTLYALNDGPSSIVGEGVYRREADGTWTALGPNQSPLYDTDLISIAFSETNPDLIVAGGSDSGTAFGFEATIWLSEDAGATWTKAYEGSNRSEDVNAIEIVADGTDQTMVAVFSDFSSEEGYTGGSLQSTDGGHTWSPTGLGNYLVRDPRLAAVPGQPLVFFAGAAYHGGLYRSLDGGWSWHWVSNCGLVEAVRADPVQNGVLYIAHKTVPMIGRSQDGGSSFTDFAGGLETAGPPAVLAARSDDRTLLMLATRAGAFVHEVGISPVPELPRDETRLRCYPNPFNPLTTLSFDLLRKEAVRLHVFDVAGRLVRALIDGEVLGQGVHEKVWRGRDERGRLVASGRYFARLEVGGRGETLALVLVK